MLHSALSQSQISVRALKGFSLMLFGSLALTSAVHGQVATTTQLTVSAPSVAVGVPTLLTATVTDSASHAVHSGTVTFFDGTRSLGSAQIVSGTSGAFPQGTANLKTASFLQGANSITAVFAGTNSDSKSTSMAKTVTVTGGIETSVALSGYATGTDFWLPATLRAFGTGVPTGSIDFLQLSAGVPFHTVGSKSLTGAKWKTDLSISSASTVGMRPVGLAVGDFNGDGIPDLAAANFDQPSDDISILLGKGDGTFESQVKYPYAGLPIGVNVADVNNDGKLDLAVVNEDGAVGILLGNGDGTFQPVVEYGSEPNVYFAAVGDLNRDGNLDIVMGGNNAAIVVLLGNGDGTFQTQKIYALNGATFDIAEGDLNGDGIPDLIVTTQSAKAGLNVLLGKGDGTFLAPQTYPLDSRFVFIALADVNGDGKLDQVLSNINLSGANQTTISVAFGKGDGTFETAHKYSITGVPGRALIFDINHDGIADLVVGVEDDELISLSYQGAVQVFPGNGDGTFQPDEITYLPGTPRAQNLITADFNGDGLPDLANVEDDHNITNAILNGETTSLVLAKEELGPGKTTVEASYAGDGTFAGSVSSKVDLTPSGTPPPSYAAGFVDASALQFNGGSVAATSLGKTVLITTGATNQMGSIFYGAPQNVQAFTTDFQFQIHGELVDGVGSATADGFTFTIQNDGFYALGGLGGGLGYKGISKSVAIKFDLFNNSGEGKNSTGLYINGESPNVPAVDLTPSGIDLHKGKVGEEETVDGDLFDAHITYDGTTLTLKLTDTVTLATFSDSWPVDIPGTVGGTTAYIGFTGATGGNVSTDQLYSWTFVPGMP